MPTSQGGEAGTAGMHMARESERGLEGANCLSNTSPLA